VADDLGHDHEGVVVNDFSTGKRDNVPEGTRFLEEDIRSGCEEVMQEFRPEYLRPNLARAWSSRDTTLPGASRHMSYKNRVDRASGWSTMAVAGISLYSARRSQAGEDVVL
jgi:hypothetical protein